VRSSVRWLAVVAGVVYAALASLTRPLTGAAAVAVAVPTAIVLILAVRQRTPAAPQGPDRRTAAASEADRPRPFAAFRGPRRRTAVAWGAVVVLAAALELVAFLRQPAYNVASPDFPTLSLLVDPVTEAGATRFVVWCCWLWVGWALVRR
jgi:hypothetical protein